MDQLKMVRPVGVYRFLTPLDTVQVGDLGRMLPEYTRDPYGTAWSPIYPGCIWTCLGQRILGGNPGDFTSWEFMRPMNEEATYVLREDIPT